MLSAEPVALVRSIYTVALTVYNVLDFQSSINVAVKNTPCLNVQLSPAPTLQPGHLTGATSLVCTAALLEPQGESVDVSAVTLSTPGGTCSGLSLNALEPVIGKTNRPVIVSGTVTAGTCRPYAVAVPVPASLSVGDTSGSSQCSPSSGCPGDVVYWSNVGADAIHRSYYGSAYLGLLETVAIQVSHRSCSHVSFSCPWVGVIYCEHNVKSRITRE